MKYRRQPGMSGWVIPGALLLALYALIVHQCTDIKARAAEPAQVSTAGATDWCGHDWQDHAGTICNQ